MHTPQEVALINFWYEFDNIFMYSTPPEVGEALDIISPYGRLLSKYTEYRTESNHQERIKTEFQGDVKYFRILADNQLKLLHDHFGDDERMEINAFTSFAQGILFDDLPRPPGSPKREGVQSIHMMNDYERSYMVWHAFIMVLVLIDDNADKTRWLQIDRYVALAAAILQKLTTLGRRPQMATVPGKNIALEESALNELENYWIRQEIGFEQIDNAIAQYVGL